MSDLTRYPLCWPDNVYRTAPQDRSWPKFHERSVADATGFLLAEINRLNERWHDYKDGSVIVSTNIPLRRDGLPFSDQKQPADTGTAVYFQLRFIRGSKFFERPIVMTCDRWNKVGYNLTAIAKDIEAQRARQRWGCTNVEQAFRGYLAIPEKCGGASWWETLGVLPTASQVEIKERFRLLAQAAHPDKGGTMDVWARLQSAYEQAMVRWTEKAS